MGRLKAALAALLAAIGVGIAASLAVADVRVREIETPVQQDSLRLVATWKSQCDVRGCPDSYRVTWATGSLQKTIETTRTVDTAWFYRPTVGDSALVTVAVVAVRRGIVSPVRNATRWLHNRDATPLPVDSLRIDTVRVDVVASRSVDTTRVWAYLNDQSLPFPYDTTAVWVTSELDSMSRALSAEIGRDTVVPIRIGAAQVSQVCVVMYNAHRREIYHVAWYATDDTGGTVYAPECATGGWVARIYDRRKPDYAIRELPPVNDSRQEIDSLLTHQLRRADASTAARLTQLLAARQRVRAEIANAPHRITTDYPQIVASTAGADSP